MCCWSISSFQYLFITWSGSRLSFEGVIVIFNLCFLVYVNSQTMYFIVSGLWKWGCGLSFGTSGRAIAWVLKGSSWLLLVFSRVWHFSDYVFYEVLTSKMMIWLQFRDFWCSSRLSFGHVIVIIICILSYVAFRRLRILPCHVFKNDDMATVLAPELCSRSSFRGVIVRIICNLPC